MTPSDFLGDIIDPGLAVLTDLGGPAPNDNARRMLLAIALQESGPELTARYQSSPATSPGPARGWWQFEQGGGVVGVLQHSATKAWAASICQCYSVVAAKEAVWRALEGHDGLSTAFARMLLYTDPAALPTTQQTGWDCYIRCWRPGKPHLEAWPGNWDTASRACRS